MILSTSLWEVIFLVSSNILLNRREFLRAACYTGLGLTIFGLACIPETGSRQKNPQSKLGIDSDPKPGEPREYSRKSKVFLVKTENRREGVRRCIALLGPLAYAGKKLLVKPNFNTADPAPGSTHNDTLEQLLLEMQSLKPSSLAVGERSGPPLTEEVLRKKRVPELCEQLGVSLINYDQLPPKEWVKFQREGLHWKDGFYVPKPVMEADVNIGTCTLKTHAYGGVFSISLKLAVGLVPRRGYPFMTELHSSPDMKKMIAEINLAYKPDFVIMDGIDVFVDGGPAQGERKKGNVFLVSRDRVALDVVGLAVLKDLGSNPSIMEVPVFGQEQIKRAVELGIGASSFQEIEVASDNDQGEQYARRLMKLLRAEA